MDPLPYKVKLLDPRWRCVRQRVIDRDRGECRDCGVREGLEVHHCVYIGENPWDTPDEYLVTLCEPCHKERHELMDEVFDAIRKLSAKMNVWHWRAATSQMREEMQRRADALAEVSETEDCDR